MTQACCNCACVSAGVFSRLHIVVYIALGRIKLISCARTTAAGCARTAIRSCWYKSTSLERDPEWIEQHTTPLLPEHVWRCAHVLCSSDDRECKCWQWIGVFVSAAGVEKIALIFLRSNTNTTWNEPRNPWKSNFEICRIVASAVRFSWPTEGF